MPVISSPEVIRLCLDKYDTYLYLKRMGLPSPTTFVDLNEAHQAIASGEFNFPLILKPRCGQGSVFLEVAHSLEELDLLWRLLNQKNWPNREQWLVKQRGRAVVDSTKSKRM